MQLFTFKIIKQKIFQKVLASFVILPSYQLFFNKIKLGVNDSEITGITLNYN
mgnify:CR=1 FL=1